MQARHPSSLMGWSSLPSEDPKLRLWRDTLHLFHKYERPPFAGPFNSLGYRFKLCRTLLTDSGGRRIPDIVCSNDRGWAVLELTTDPAPQTEQLRSYESLDPRHISAYGLQTHDSRPEVISCRAAVVGDGPYCELVLGDQLDVRKAERIVEDGLRDALTASQGTRLDRLPSATFTLHPESRGRDIRRGIQAHVLRAFAPGGSGITIMQIVEESLDGLSESVSPDTKAQLSDGVREVLRVLIQNHLSDYLELTSEDLLRPSPGFKPNPRSFGVIERKVRDWAHVPPPLESFDSSAHPPRSSPPAPRPTPGSASTG